MPLAVLDSTSNSITVELSGAAATTAPEFGAVWYDEVNGTRDWHSTVGAFNGTTPVAAVAAPAAATCRRVVCCVSVSNKDSASITATVKVAGAGKVVGRASIATLRGYTFGKIDSPVAALDLTTKSLAVKLASAVAATQPDFVASWHEFGDAHATAGSFNGTTEVEAMAAPGSGFARRVCWDLWVANRDSAAITAILIQRVSGGTDREISRITLAAGASGSFALSSVLSVYQPWDADLDTWAALTPTAFFQTLVDDASAGAVLNTLGLSANGQSLVSAANYAAMRALLDLEAGTDFYSMSAADAAFQPKDSDLTAIAGLAATTDNFMQAKSSAWASRTPTQVTADLIAVVGDSGSGGTKGVVPAPGAGDAAASKYLKADGTWAAVSAGNLTGDVTSSGLATTISQANIDHVCNGRLTVTSGTPIVVSSSQVTSTTIYFTPYRGNRIALFDGTLWSTIEFSETSEALPSIAADKPYDVFGYNNGGVLDLELLAWTDDTTRATALVLQDGVLVKSGATTRRYLGSIYISAASDNTTEGPFTQHVWNYYNRVPHRLYAQVPDNTWTKSSATWGEIGISSPIDGNSRVSMMIGYQENSALAFARTGYSYSASGAQYYGFGIAVDQGTGTPTNIAVAHGAYASPALAATQIPSAYAFYVGVPGIGRQVVRMIDASPSGVTITSAGDDGAPASLQAGLVVEFLA